MKIHGFPLRMNWYCVNEYGDWRRLSAFAAQYTIEVAIAREREGVRERLVPANAGSRGADCWPLMADC